MNDLVKVTARKRPFLADFETRYVPTGTTIGEIVASLYPIAKIRACAVAFLDGRPVPPEQWHYAPRPGELLNVSLVPQDPLGIGSDTLRVALTVAIGFAGMVGDKFIKGPLGWAMSTVGLLGGALLANWLIPAAETTIADTGHSISGSRNSITQWGSWPKIYGRVRFTPPLAALPYTESLGENQYLRALFVLGYGPLTVRDVRVGDVPIFTAAGEVAFENIQLEIREGLPDDLPITLVTKSVKEDELNTKLYYGQDDVIRITENDIDEISIDLSFPSGLCDKRGDDIIGWSVYFRIRYRPHGTGDDAWTEVDEVSANQLYELATLAGNGSAGTVNWLNGLTSGLNAAAADIAALATEDWGATQEVHDRLIVWIDNAVNAIANARNPQNDATLFQALEDCANAIALISPLVGGVAIVPISGVAAAAQAITDVLCLILDAVKVLVEISDYREQGYGPALSTFPQLEQWWIRLRGLQYLFPEVTVDEARITGATERPIRHGYRWSVQRGMYDVWIAKTQPDVDPEEHEDVHEEMYWSVLRSIQNKRPVRTDLLPPMAYLAIRVKASDQFTGSLDRVNVDLAARLPVATPDGYGGYTWTVEETRNPAWAWLDALCGPNRPGLPEQALCHVPRPVALDRIESLDDVYDWAVTCDNEEFAVNGEPLRVGRTFDLALTKQMTQDSLAKTIAAAGQASHGRPGNKFGIVRDIELTVPDQHFTPANSWGFGCVQRHQKLPNALRVTFTDAERDFQAVERIVYDDGYGDEVGDIPAVTFESIDLVGCSDARQAWCDGRNYLAQMKLRPRRFTLNCMGEHVTCRRGGLVRVTHDVPMWGLAWGRVRTITAAMTDDPVPVPVDPPVTLLTFDNSIPMQAGHTYTLVLVYQDGWGQEVELDGVLFDDEYSSASFQGEFPLSPASDASAGGVAAAVGDMWMAGEQGAVTQDLKVVDIQCGKDMTATLSLVDAAPDIHRDPNLEIPDFKPGTFVPPVLEVPRPAPPQIAEYPPGDGRAGQLMILADERACIQNPDGSLTPTIIVCLQQAAFPAGITVPDALEVQHRRLADAGHAESVNMQFWVTQAALPIDTRQVQIRGISEGHTYDVRLRFTCRTGLCSAWAEATVYLSGKTNPPPDVPSASLDNGVTLRWSYPDSLRPVDFKGFVVRQYPAILAADQWSAALPVEDGYITNTMLDVSMYTAGPRTFFVKALDTSGNESYAAAIVQTNLAGATPENVIYTFSVAGASWAGTLRGCEVDAGKLKASADPLGALLPMYPPPWTDPMYPPNEGDAFYQQGWSAGDFTWDFTPPAGTGGYPLTVSVDAVDAAFDLWFGTSAVDLRPWPGQIIADEAVTYWFQLEIKAAGATAARPTFNDISILVDVPDITEHFEDLTISDYDADTGIRLPIARTYHEILGVGGLTMQQDDYKAVVIKVVDKGSPSAVAPTEGPLVKALNAAGDAVQVDAFDATVWGY